MKPVFGPLKKLSGDMKNWENLNDGERHLSAATQAVQFTVEIQGGKTIEPVIPVIDTITNQQYETGNDIEPTQTAGPTCSMEDGCNSCGS